jgi:RNA polymerase sigma factor (sigma-70 family)
VGRSRRHSAQPMTSDDKAGSAGYRARPESAIGGSTIGPVPSMATAREDFVAFADAEYHQVVRFLMRTGVGLEEAKDLTQHAFMRGWEKVLRGRWPEVAHPRAWVRQVALNLRGAQAWVEAPVDELPEAPAPASEHAELTDQALDVVAALALVTDAKARAVLAFDLDDVPGPAIANALGITEQQVRDLRKKARRTLKRHLAPRAPRPAGTRPAAAGGRDG